MAKVKLADWKEQIRTPEIECMSIKPNKQKNKKPK